MVNSYNQLLTLAKASTYSSDPTTKAIILKGLLGAAKGAGSQSFGEGFSRGAGLPIPAPVPQITCNTTTFGNTSSTNCY